MRDTIATYMIPMLYPAGLWSALLLAWATPLTRLVYGARWTPAAPAIRIYGIAGLPAVVCWVTDCAYASVNPNTTDLRAVAAKTAMPFRARRTPGVRPFTGMSVAAPVTSGSQQASG